MMWFQARKSGNRICLNLRRFAAVGAIPVLSAIRCSKLWIRPVRLVLVAGRPGLLA